jgi:hypothetical protein
MAGVRGRSYPIGMFKRLAFVLTTLAGILVGVARLPEPYRQWGINGLIVAAFVVLPLAQIAAWLVAYGFVRHTISRGVSDGFLDAAERYRRLHR